MQHKAIISMNYFSTIHSIYNSNKIFDIKGDLTL